MSMCRNKRSKLIRKLQRSTLDVHLSCPVSDDSLTIEKVSDFCLTLDEISLTLFKLHRQVLLDSTAKNSDDPWSWHYLSSFFRYKTLRTDKAYDAAEKSVNILVSKNDFIGAISRNYVYLASVINKLDKRNAEICRLMNANPPKSEILLGILEDSKQYSFYDSLDAVFLEKLEKMIS